ncbi:uncharacterized protein Z519_01724 [Cladophialophora bantiana CBS 173.52]|uniref:NAD(P)-binding protein n=1 Tax=Cladophialophora bantiana (strain ATCC 10958 / CBS 173.52 / CDC B-1940 / NIH 8579) TaxID=1442370 RepID=A0A0D2I4G0_CLAB1|nr:uncharacterized protein Z519_01724 [Cladophialophora bantiana CBS 173.52]KIW98140.1 hypothetical protein Z519_01724 [Cladophialophora bantiana CBS 173.52]
MSFKGIGRGTAIALAEEGCSRLLLADIDYNGLEETKEQIQRINPSTAVHIQRTDISDEVSVQQMVDACVLVFGRLDYALNIAGVVPQRKGIAEVDLETYDKVINVNVHGTWLCHRAEIRQMMRQPPLEGHGQTRGSIVTVSSLAGMNASSGMSAYCASKHSLIGLAKADAQDYGPHGVRINVVCPGMIDTELFRQTSPADAPPKLVAITPIRRLGMPEDVAWLMAFLCSAKSSFVHGAVIPCDGGLVLQRGVI